MIKILLKKSNSVVANFSLRLCTQTEVCYSTQAEACDYHLQQYLYGENLIASSGSLNFDL